MAIRMRIDVCDLNGHILSTASSSFDPSEKYPNGVESAIAEWRGRLGVALVTDLEPGSYRIHVNRDG